MSLTFADGFDKYSTEEQLRQRWNTIVEVTGTAFASLSPHNHGKSLFSNTATNGGDAIFSFKRHHNAVENTPSGIVGFHFRTSDITQNVTVPIISFVQTIDPNFQVTVRYANNGQIELYRANTILLGSGGSISNNEWNHFEIKYQILDEIGEDMFVVRLNGSEIINLASGTNTNNLGGTCGGIRLKGEDLADRYWDNLYIMDLEGAINNDFLGETFIETIVPTGDGSQDNFFGSDSNQENNFAHVDDSTPDDDTTYNETATSGDIAVYKFASPTGNIGTIHGINLVSRARKTTSALGFFTNVAKVSGSDFSQTDLSIARSYDYVDTVVESNPQTTEAWKLNDLSVNEFGVQFKS